MELGGIPEPEGNLERFCFCITNLIYATPFLPWKESHETFSHQSQLEASNWKQASRTCFFSFTVFDKYFV